METINVFQRDLRNLQAVTLRSAPKSWGFQFLLLFFRWGDAEYDVDDADDDDNDNESWWW